ncbi:AfsR/SARP family transcriptional regulator [Planobispora longispora]|nr:AfsR/SARP family transcriptional regulator [Planobispora longispora]
MLGPLEIHENGRQIRITAPKQRVLLALLLLDANQVITEERLIDELWNGSPPAAARSSLQAYVYRLRKELAGGEGVALRRDGDGYRLRVAAGSRDVERFERAVSAAADIRDPCQAVPRLRAALREWRGELLAGIDVRSVADERARYDSMRLAALERCVRGELALGRDGELVAELESLVRQYPLSESLWGSLVMALRRAGRRGDAAAAYARARRCLVEELGMEPGAELQQLHREILEGAVTRPPDGSPTDGAEERPVPAQLPAGIADFTGRSREVGELVAAADAEESPVMLIAGPAGVGKTALAVHVAHRLRDRYPDGQLHVDLGGVQRASERPADVLAGFLRALGSTGPPPSSETERIALYRSVLSRRRVLVVLDNAADVSQVRPLLATGPACATVITSRDSLATLPVGRRIRLGMFAEDEAVEFLGRIVGGRDERPDAETAAEVSRLCGHLPLALRIAGARAESLMGSSLTMLAERLADHRRRLAELELDDLSVNSSFELSYELLGNRPRAARAFRLLGLIDGPDITVESAAALLGVSPVAAATALFDLVRTQLLEPYRPGRYRMHDLVRLYAAQRAGIDSPDELSGAVNRLLDAYRALAGHAVRVLTERSSEASSPSHPFAGAQEALTWFDAERPNLLAAIRAGLRSPECEEAAVATVRALTWLFRFRGSTEEWVRVNESVLSAARRRGNPAHVADTLDELGKLRRERGDLPAALAYAQNCLKVRQEIGDIGGEVRGHINLGVAHHLMGSTDEAAHHYGIALTAAEQAGDRLAQGYALANLAAVHREAGRYDDAQACNAASVKLCRELGDNPGQIDALDDLATTHRAAGRFGESLEALTGALEIAERIGYVTRVANLLCEIGETRLAGNDAVGGIAPVTRAVGIFGETSDRYGRGRALRLLGRLYRSAGDAESARRCWEEALTELTDLGVPEAEEVRVLVAGR